MVSIVYEYLLTRFEILHDCYVIGNYPLQVFLLYAYHVLIVKYRTKLYCSTGNPLYNDIRYNSIIRYNVNPICTKISGSCIFSLKYHVILWENIRFGYLLESPCRGDSNKYTKRMIY